MEKPKRRICDGGMIPIERMLKLYDDYYRYCMWFKAMRANGETCSDTPQRFKEWVQTQPIEK